MTVQLGVTATDVFDDLTIAADGLRSTHRAALNGQQVPFFTGQTAWRALIPDPGSKPEAQVWLNIGFSQTVVNPDTKKPESVFVAMPQGIPIDTQEFLDTSKIRNADYAKLIAGRNSVLKLVQEEAAKLAPGAEVIIGDPGSLQIQLRRRMLEAEAPSEDPSENPFVRTSLSAPKVEQPPAK